MHTPEIASAFQPLPHGKGFLLRTCAKKGGVKYKKEPVNLSEFPISSLALCLATGSNQYVVLFVHQIPALCRH